MEIPSPTYSFLIAERFAREGLGQARMDVFDECIAEGVVVNTALNPAGPILGRENYKRVFAEFAESWPCEKFEIHDAFAAGDKAVVRFTATCVFRKDYYGVPADGLVAPLHEIHVYAVREGKIAEVFVGGVNVPFEYAMYPVLKDAVLGSLEKRN